jgi:hypothetical protein
VAQGRAVHATVRPGGHEIDTVLVLYRVEPPELGPRYELRYLNVTEDGPSDLFWFPWRLQVHAEVAEVLDVPPVPVWSPEGDALAWIEWDARDTLLRVLVWHDDGVSSNPSDTVSTYRLTDVAAGTQLTSWEDSEGRTFRAIDPDGEVVEVELRSVGVVSSFRDA